MTDCWPINIWCGAGRNVTPLSITEHLKSFSPTGCLWQWKVSSEVINYYQLQQASKPASWSIKYQERCVVYGGAWCGCVSPPTSADIWDWAGPGRAKLPPSLVTSTFLVSQFHHQLGFSQTGPTLSSLLLALPTSHPTSDGSQMEKILLIWLLGSVSSNKATPLWLMWCPEQISFHPSHHNK